MVTLKSSQNRMTFAAENFKVRNYQIEWSFTKKQVKLLRNPSEREVFLMILFHK